MPGFKGTHRINAYHEIASPAQANDLTKQAVEYLLPGVHIDRVVALDFDAFQKVVDLLGGVPVVIDRAMDYDDNAGGLHIHFKPGPQVLDGYNAMCYVRFRHADSDFARQERQKEFLVDLKQQMIRNWTSLPDVLNIAPAVMGNVLSVDELASLAGFAKTVQPQDIQMGMTPVTERPGSSMLHLDKKNTPAVLAKFGLLDSPQTEAVGSKR
jgi:LCP family protein required for cell wall assembly